MSSSTYPGTELDTFAAARNWKAYVLEAIRRELTGRVLEVGGGIGSTTAAFRSASQHRWYALEPDLRLAVRLKARAVQLAEPVGVVAGTLAAIDAAARFDAILYADVLEHMTNDREELEAAASRLAPGGALIVLAPAHQALYTPFDAAVGHVRRYDRRSMQALTPPRTRLARLAYLDSVGLLLSAANRWVLRSSTPSSRQVLFWDRVCIPISRRLDALTRGRLGKSVLAIWRREAL